MKEANKIMKMIKKRKIKFTVKIVIKMLVNKSPITE